MQLTTDRKILFENLKEGAKIFIHTAIMRPHQLMEELALYIKEKNIKGIILYQLHTEGHSSLYTEEFKSYVKVKAFFLGANVRLGLKTGMVDYIPIFLSEIPSLFKSRNIQLDYALIQTGSVDEHGYCSLGTSIDITLAAIENAKTVIAEINTKVPRTHGLGFISKNKINFAIEVERDLPSCPVEKISEEEHKIGSHIASLIEDGSTIQTGIGNIPNATLNALTHHKNLGIHTEMFSDGIIPLIESGVITNNSKKVFPGKIVSSFCMGSSNLYRFINNNPLFSFQPADIVNDTQVIRKNPRVVAINSAIAVDLTGQVCADSIGHKIFSGVGGQMDFMRGASLSEGGKPIIAFKSVTNKGESKITFELTPGSGVVTTRAHVHYIVTEFGIASLYGKSLEERAEALINIAHPNFRESLARKWRER